MIYVNRHFAFTSSDILFESIFADIFLTVCINNWKKLWKADRHKMKELRKHHNNKQTNLKSIPAGTTKKIHGWKCEQHRNKAQHFSEFLFLLLLCIALLSIVVSVAALVYKQIYPCQHNKDITDRIQQHGGKSVCVCVCLCVCVCEYENKSTYT